VEGGAGDGTTTRYSAVRAVVEGAGRVAAAVVVGFSDLPSPGTRLAAGVEGFGWRLAADLAGGFPAEALAVLLTGRELGLAVFFFGFPACFPTAAAGFFDGVRVAADFRTGWSLVMAAGFFFGLVAVAGVVALVLVLGAGAVSADGAGGGRAVSAAVETAAGVASSARVWWLMAAAIRTMENSDLNMGWAGVGWMG